MARTTLTQFVQLVRMRIRSISDTTRSGGLWRVGANWRSCLSALSRLARLPSCSQALALRDVRPGIPTRFLARTALEAIVIAGGVILRRRGLVEELAQVEEVLLRCGTLLQLQLWMDATSRRTRAVPRGGPPIVPSIARRSGLPARAIQSADPEIARQADALQLAARALGDGVHEPDDSRHLVGG